MRQINLHQPKLWVAVNLFAEFIRRNHYPPELL